MFGAEDGPTTVRVVSDPGLPPERPVPSAGGAAVPPAGSGAPPPPPPPPPPPAPTGWPTGQGGPPQGDPGIPPTGYAAPPPPPRKRRTGLFVGLGVLAALLVGGIAAFLLTRGEDGEDPDQYAAEVCGAVGDWEDDITSSSEDLQGESSTITDPAEGKDLIVSFLDEATARTEGLTREVAEAGVPATDEGEGFSDGLLATLSEVEDLFAGAGDDARALPVDDPQAFADGATALGADLEEAGSKLGEDLTELRSDLGDDELEDAFADETDCEDLGQPGQ